MTDHKDCFQNNTYTIRPTPNYDQGSGYQIRHEHSPSVAIPTSPVHKQTLTLFSVQYNPNVLDILSFSGHSHHLFYHEHRKEFIHIASRKQEIAMVLT